MRRQLRIVASASDPGDTLQLALAAEHASSSSTQRLAAFVRRLQVRRYLGDVALGVIAGTVVMVLLAIAGVFR